MKYLCLSLGFQLFLIFNFSFSQSLFLNEVMGSNQTTIADFQGDFEDWIELYNSGGDPIDLTGYGLSDNPTLPFKWVFPSVTIEANSFLIVWASGKNVVGSGNELHTNFSVSSTGESLILTSPSGVLVDSSPALPFQIDVSIGRQPDGSGSWVYFYESTPGSANLGLGLPELVLSPTFSHTSGLFEESFQLVLSHANPEATIVYTTDGSEPLLENLSGSTFNYKNEYPLQVGSAFGPLLSEAYTSNVYSQPILIVDKSPLPNKVSIKNTSQSPNHIPSSPVRKGTVVKARAYIDGIGSPVVGQTFFVWPSGNPYEIPVVSIIIPETSLFDYNNGIYTAGIDFDTWRTNQPTNPQYWRPEWNNYWRSGIDWEYPIHFEVFAPNNFSTILSQKSGMRIHGNNSRALHIKNLRIYARGLYDGNSTFDLPVFNSSIPFSTNPTNTISKRILLRPDGSGGPIAYDVAFNRLMQPVFEGVTRIEHAIHFINGEFWGLTAFRDRFDRHHYANYFGVSDSNVVQIDCKGANCNLDEGTDQDFQEFIALREFVNQNDMSLQNNFLQVDAQLDMRSFIDHMVLQIFSADNSYERFFWKTKVPENDAFGDGKWRLATQDFEAALSSSENWLQFWSNVADIDPNSRWFGKLLENTSFRNRFINRYADLLNTAFLPSRFSQVVEHLFDEVEPYLPEDIHRMPRGQFYQQSQKINLLNWAIQRPDSERTNLLNHFNLSNTASITIQVDAQNAGSVQVNTVKIEPSTPGVSNNPYPWTGIYFDGVPVQLTAIANTGFVFSHWSGTLNSTDETIEFNPEGEVNLTAHFTEIVDQTNTAYFWLMGTQIPNNTPLLSLPSTFSVTQITAELHYESCLEGYPFENSHPLWRKASMERRNSPTPINYRPVANNDIPFEDAAMRGIQIKQPFQNNGLENTLVLAFSTLGLEQIKVSMAAETDGAAEYIVFDYWDGQEWIQDELPQYQFQIAEGYQLIDVDFTNVTLANNQNDFRVRLRFGGADMSADNGKRVHLNNIAVDGLYGLGLNEDIKSEQVVVYPNPSEGLFQIQSMNSIEYLTVIDLMGRTLKIQSVSSNQSNLDIQNLSNGVYWLLVKTYDDTIVKRIVKY